MKKITKAELAKRNAEFNALTPMKKRVAVAKDVLLQIKVGKFVPGSGYGDLIGTDMESAGGNIQTLIQKNGVYCVGCAKAAAVIAKARLGNNLYGFVGEHVDEPVDDIFGKELASLLEAMYEGWSGFKYLGGRKIGRDERVALKRYEKSLPDRFNYPTARMTAIYQNIVTNRGRLVIETYKY